MILQLRCGKTLTDKVDIRDMKDLMNRAQCSSAHPCCIIVLIDQSVMMAERSNVNESFSVKATKEVNRLIDRLIEIHFDGEKPRNRCFISILGYNNEVNELTSGWLRDFEEKVLRFEDKMMTIPDGVGGTIDINVKIPEWIDPIAEDNSNIAKALMKAESISQKWVKDFPENPTPIIYHISSLPSFLKSHFRCAEEITHISDRIRNTLNNSGDPTLIINTYLSRDTVEQKLMSDNEMLILQNMSSEVNEDYMSMYRWKWDSRLFENGYMFEIVEDKIQSPQFICHLTSR